MTDLTHPRDPDLKYTGTPSGVFRPLSRLLELIKQRLLSPSGKRNENRESDTCKENSRDSENNSENSREKLSANNPRPNRQGDDKQDSAGKLDVSGTSSSGPLGEGSDSGISNLGETVPKDQDQSKGFESQDAFAEASPSDFAQSQVETPEDLFGTRQHPGEDQLSGSGLSLSSFSSRFSNSTQGFESPELTKGPQFFKRQFKNPREKSLQVVSTFFEKTASIARAGFVFSFVGHLPWLALSAYFRFSYFGLSRDYYYASDYLLEMPTGVIHWTGVALGAIASLLWFSMRSGELREDRNDSVQVVTYSAKDVQKKAESPVHQYKNATIIDRSAEQKLDGSDKIELRAVRIPGRVAGSIFKNLRSAVLDIGLLGMLYWSSKLSATVGYSTIPSNPGLVFWFGLGCVAADWMLRGVNGLLGWLHYKLPRR